ncbi:MAG: hypothetical protein IJ523_11185 [Succinivibrionaceae bacterium]|nr:hypothetical protein [Succinivibrionaceae bacterium]
MRNFDLKLVANEKDFRTKTEMMLATETDPKLVELIRCGTAYIEPLYNSDFEDVYHYLAYDTWTQCRDCFRGFVVNNCDIISTVFCLMNLARRNGCPRDLIMDIDTIGLVWGYLKEEYNDLADLTCDEIAPRVKSAMHACQMAIHLAYGGLVEQSLARKTDTNWEEFFKNDPKEKKRICDLLGNLLVYSSLNCVPMYNEDFKRGLREFGITDTLSEKSLSELCDFFKSNHLEDFYGESHEWITFEENGTTFTRPTRRGLPKIWGPTSITQMRYLDICFSQLGKKLAAEESASKSGADESAKESSEATDKKAPENSV